MPETRTTPSASWKARPAAWDSPWRDRRSRQMEPHTTPRQKNEAGGDWALFADASFCYTEKTPWPRNNPPQRTRNRLKPLPPPRPKAPANRKPRSRRPNESPGPPRARKRRNPTRLLPRARQESPNQGRRRRPQKRL